MGTKSFRGGEYHQMINARYRERGDYMIAVLNTLTEKFGWDRAVQISELIMWNYGMLKPDFSQGNPGCLWGFYRAATGGDGYDDGTLPMTVEHLCNEKVVLHVNRGGVGCGLLDSWKALGMSDEACSKMCDIACYGDYGHMEKMGLKCKFPYSIARGDECCELYIERKE